MVAVSADSPSARATTQPTNASSHTKLPSRELGSKPTREVPLAPGHSNKPSRGVPVPPAVGTGTTKMNPPAVDTLSKDAPQSSPQAENGIVCGETFGKSDSKSKANGIPLPQTSRPPLKKTMSFKLSMRSFAQWRKTKKHQKAVSQSMRSIPTGGQALPVPIPNKASSDEPNGIPASKSTHSEKSSKSSEPQENDKKGSGTGTGHHRGASSMLFSWANGIKKAKGVDGSSSAHGPTASVAGLTECLPAPVPAPVPVATSSKSESQSSGDAKPKESGGGVSSSGGSPAPSPSSSLPPSSASSEIDGEGV